MNTIRAMMVALVVGVALLASPLATQASTITNKISYLLYEGEVNLGDAEKLESLIAFTGVSTVHLNSEGGAAIEGYKLGYLFKKLGVSVVVAEGEYCLSACAIAFLGGESKTLDGFIGFHVAWTDGGGTMTEGLRAGQWFGALNSLYHFKMGYTAQLPMIVSMLTDESTFLVFEDMPDLALFRMVDREYDLFTDLPHNWFANHIAGPTRLSLLIQGL